MPIGTVAKSYSQKRKSFWQLSTDLICEVTVGDHEQHTLRHTRSGSSHDLKHTFTLEGFPEPISWILTFPRFNACLRLSSSEQIIEEDNGLSNLVTSGSKQPFRWGIGRGRRFAKFGRREFTHRDYKNYVEFQAPKELLPVSILMAYLLFEGVPSYPSD